MTTVTDTTLQGETPQTQPVVEPQVTAPTNAGQQPAQEPPVEEWDKERAATTIKAQRAEANELRKQLKELETLKAEKKQREEAELTEQQRLQKQADELKAENARLQADIWKSKAASETGIPSILAERLQGKSYDEVLADAKKLAESLPKKTAPGLPPTNPGNADPNETDAQKRARIFGNNADPFAGGGVVWKDKPI
jgi:hypothetical protein